jgi:signal transduction histidine kinase
MVGSETETARVLDPIVHHGILSTSLVRVKLWTLQGKVLYSDEPNLIGLTFPLDGEARASLLSKRTDASISDLQRPENRYERGQGRMLEVYRPMWTPNGQPLLLETYFRYQVVTERSHNLWRGFAGIMLSSLVAVFALMLPLVWALLHRTRRAQQQREAMMQRALAASQDERKRIAGTLHDGVVQQLAAASFTVSAEAARASVTGDQESASRLGSASAAVRSGMAGLRSLLVDIYPPSLTDGGLTVALNDMAGTMAGRDVDINVHVQDSTSDGLPAEIQEAIFRVAQESVRNAVRHAAAQRIDLTLTTVDGAVQLDVIDDGAGFDLPSKARASDRGHLGLRLIADVADRTGADLAIATSPTTGTHVRMNVAAQ